MSSSQMEKLHAEKRADLGQRLAKNVPDDATLKMIANLGTGNVLGLGHTQALDTMLTNGDDSLDAFQGIYWTLKNRFLFDKPLLVDSHVDCPIVVCGSGPSLLQHLDILRKNQDNIFIVAGESTTLVLSENGIMADMVCPVERIDTRDYCMRAVEDSAWYGGLPLVPRISQRMNKHLSIVGPSQYIDWLDLDQADLQTNCPLSGAQAVCNGNYLSVKKQAPVYLVGHDLCYIDNQSHVSGYESFEFGTHDGPKLANVLCNDGLMRDTTPEWLRTTGMLSQVVKRRPNVYNCSSKGANFGFIETRDLPKTFADCSKELVTGRKPNVDIGRLLTAQARVADDAGRLMSSFSKLKCEDDMDLLDILGKDNPNWNLFEIMLRPLYIQLSILKRLEPGINPLRHAKQAVHNTLGGLMPLIEELQEEAKW